jgi:Family of unknown function (DUF6011)
MTGTASTETVTEARCLRPGCGRKLTDPKSIALGMGPRCAAKVRAASETADLSAWTASQVADARQAIEDGAVVPSNARACSTSSATTARKCTSSTATGATARAA